MKTNFLVLFVASALIILSGCRTTPVLNIENAPIEIASKHTSSDIKKAIKSAGVRLGWTMKNKKAGLIVGTLYIKQHVAVVNIKYTKTSYNITYNDSQNLKFDGINIHQNYNKWVTNLHRQIQAEFSNI